MSKRSSFELLLLAALWGGSFLLMRLGAVEFSSASLVFVRVAGASALLLPLLLLRNGKGAQGLGALRTHWRPLAVVGVLNSALPFFLFMVGAQVLTAGLMSIFNATAPIWGALIAWWWLGDRLDRWRVLGMVIGVAGVIGLAWDKADLKTGVSSITGGTGLGDITPLWGMAACLGATVCYGIAGNYSRRRLAGVPPLVVATGSQLWASVVLLLPALFTWPAVAPSAAAWGSAAVLALACTALAYVLYFRLIEQAGTATAMSVTFLIPAFALLWGWMFLHEQPTGGTLLGCGVILLGTALATGRLRLSSKGKGG